MHFALTDEQRALQDAVRSFLRDRFGPQQVRAVYEDPASDGDPAELWKAVGEQGWLAVLVPEQYDGVGLGLLDAAVLARAFGAATAPGPWLPTLLATEAVRLAGSDEQRAELLPALAAGERKAAVALLRPNASPTPAGAPFAAAGDTVSGRLELVDYAHVADLLVVAATDGSLLLVDPRGSGVTIERFDALDRTTRMAHVTLDAAPATRLGNSSPQVLQDLLDRAAVLAANDLVGIARKAITDTVEYDKTRVQFGRPVGSFQAIKHDLADLHIGVTMAEHAALYAAHALDVDAADKALAVSIAKSKAGDTAEQATSAMIQYHGGIGYTWEHDTHFYFKRSKRLQYVYGDAAQHRERIARLLIDGRAARGGAVDPATPAGTQSVQGSGVPAAATTGAA
jgi:alkylation response protein AidB-like acyl-CoA dehydrogenase